MTDVLLRMLVGVTVGLLLVLLLRRPARRASGPGPAFLLWLLPVALALGPLLPQQFAPGLGVTLPGLIVTPHATSTVGAGPSTGAWEYVAQALWLCGAAFGLARLAWHYVRLRRRALPARAAWMPWLGRMAPTLDPRRVCVHAAGPAVLWALPRALVLLPEDFSERFVNDTTRQLVLRHELMHLRRGDAWWSLAMEIASALLWFHPLAWVARSRFRLDQELACDAAALRAAPQNHARYARALLDSVAALPVPALIPWLAESQLKARIAMISRIPPRARRRRAGFLAVALVLAGGLFVAGGQLPAEAATHPASSSASPSVDVSYKNHNPPRYPENAIKNGEVGTVMLRIHVGADGNVAKVDIDHAETTTSSAELQAAAVMAAERWKFNPAVKDGKAVSGWITVPVGFSLNPGSSTDPCPAGKTYDRTASTCVLTAPRNTPAAASAL